MLTNRPNGKQKNRPRGSCKLETKDGIKKLVTPTEQFIYLLDRQSTCFFPHQDPYSIFGFQM